MFHWHIKFWNLMNIGVLVCWKCLKTLVLRNCISALTCFTTICRNLAVCVFYKVPLMCLTPFLFGGLEGDSFLVMAFFKRNFVIELLRGFSPCSWNVDISWWSSFAHLCGPGCIDVWHLLLQMSGFDMWNTSWKRSVSWDNISGEGSVVIVKTFLFRNH